MVHVAFHRPLNLSEPGLPKACWSHLLACLEDSEEAPGLGLWGREFLWENFSYFLVIHRMTTDTQTVYLD